VAKLAGITKEILEKAKYHLQELEIKSKGLKENDNLNKLFAKQEINLKSDPKFDKIKAMLSSFDTDNMTPLQALQFLAKIKEIFEE
jgi:DNA mismatch repair ATPase MutS